jgi:glycosyltransferase involved in cell wall biosynthesis
MQCGLPVISSNTASMPKVIGDADILLDPHDQDAWRAAMLRRELRPTQIKFYQNRFITSKRLNLTPLF